MRGFRFRLEKVRGLRSAEEQEKARALAQAQARMEQIQAVVDAVAGSEAGVRDRIREAVLDNQSVGVVQNLQVLLGQLRRQRAVAEADRAKADEAVKAARDELLRASQERQILDRLHDRQLGAWRQEEARREQSVLDEVSRRQGGASSGGTGQ